MASARREALLSKVLTRLYPGKISNSATAKLPSVQSENETLLRPARETHVEVVQPPTFPAGSDLKGSDLKQEEHNGSVDADLNHEQSRVSVIEQGSPPQQKFYTVSLPPDDYVSGSQRDAKSSPTEESDLSEDAEVERPVERRKRRRRKKKVNVMTPSAPDEKNLQETQHQPQTFERGTINKNKKRKLQRKRQKERWKAAGLWPKVKAVAFIEDEDVVQTDEQTEEEKGRKTEDLLDFLQATQEIYFTESKSMCADSVLSIDLIVEILHQIRSGAVPFSEVLLLHHLKNLLLLQDIERLKDSLDSFKEHSSMPLDHTMALCSLFYYWITNILPIKANHVV